MKKGNRFRVYVYLKKLLNVSYFFAFSFLVHAQSQYFPTPQLLAPCLANAPAVSSRAAVLIDAETGTLLYSKNPDEEIPPASLTKLMTMHLVMKEVKEGNASYDEIIPVTVESWAQSQPRGSSLMFLEPRQIVTLREIMLGLAVSSGNDAAVAAALRFAPNMDEFADRMTMEARRMGMKVTRFVESSGISGHNITTAAEFAWFCRQYIAMHPESLSDFHSVPVFSYPVARNVPNVNADPITGFLPYINTRIPHTFHQENRNSLLKSFPGTDGLKTGYIEESGYNIALTAERNGTRFISVTMGAPNSRIRDIEGTVLLSWAFDNFKTVRPDIGIIESQRLWKGIADSVHLVLAHSPDFTSPADRADTLVSEVFIPELLIAPISAGTTAGYYIISDEYGELNRIPLITTQSYERGNIFKRIWHSIRLFFNR